MQITHIGYDSPLDAIVAITKRLSAYELLYNMTSKIFSDQFNREQLDDRIDFIEWANDYRHFLALKFEIEEVLSHAHDRKVVYSKKRWH